MQSTVYQNRDYSNVCLDVRCRAPEPHFTVDQIISPLVAAAQVTRLLDLSEVPVLETLVEVKELASVKPAEAFKDIAASISALTFFNVAKHSTERRK